MKEFEDVYFPRYALILDNFSEQGDDDLFEESVSVAASFASVVDGRRGMLDLMFIKDKATVVKAGRGEDRAGELLEVLAAVEAVPEENFDDLESLVRRHADQFAGCICVFTGWTPERARFLRNLMAAGLETLALILCREETRTRAMIEGDPIPCPHVFLKPPDVQEALLKL